MPCTFTPANNPGNLPRCSAPGGPPVNLSIQNVGKVRVFGGELNTVWAPIASDRFSANVSLNDSKINSPLLIGLLPNQVNVQNARLPNAPKWAGKSNIPLGRVDAVFISHLHFDHVGGPQAILGMRYQTDLPGRLLIYGPPGTKGMVEGLVASMAPAAAENLGLPVPKTRSPADAVQVVEMTDGAVVEVGAVRVRAVGNSHYSVPRGGTRARGTLLSFRFDAPLRSIGYTGDTGPSPAVARLMAGVDLLVSEMVYVEAFGSGLRRSMPNLPPAALEGVSRQMREHHLTPDKFGRLAASALPGRLVVTHLIPGDLSRTAIAKDTATIRNEYGGRVAFVVDGEAF